jgi:hypothetical protein
MQPGGAHCVIPSLFSPNAVEANYEIAARVDSFTTTSLARRLIFFAASAPGWCYWGLAGLVGRTTYVQRGRPFGVYTYRCFDLIQGFSCYANIKYTRA